MWKWTLAQGEHRKTDPESEECTVSAWGGQRSREGEGRGEEKRLHSIGSSCFHGDGSGSGSELSRWKQTAALIHQPRPTSHTGRLCSPGTEDPGRDVGAAWAFFCHLLSGTARGRVKTPPKASAGGRWCRGPLRATAVGGARLPYF